MHSSAEATILVTGATGFVGRFLMPALESAWPGAELVGVGHEAGPWNHEGVDITDPQQVDRLVAQTRPDVTIHLAGQANVGVSFDQPDKTWAINLTGSLNLFNALRQHARDSALINIGSSDCYGASFKAGSPLDESAPLEPQNPYAASKAAADIAACELAATSGIRVIRARPFNHSGPGQEPGFVLPAFAAQVARIEAGEASAMQVGNLEAVRDFTHVSDVAMAYVALTRQLLEGAAEPDSGEAINIASGHGVSIQTLLDLMRDQARCPIPVEQDPARLRASDIPVATGNAGRLKELTGWYPRYSHQALVQELLAYWRNR